jgi:hypothetical protein
LLAQDRRPTLYQSEIAEQFTLEAVRPNAVDTADADPDRCSCDFHSSGTQPLEMANQISIAWGDRGRVRPIGSAFTDPGRRLSRARHFPKAGSCRPRCPQAAKPEESAHGLGLVPCSHCTLAAADLGDTIGRSWSVSCHSVIRTVQSCPSGHMCPPREPMILCPNTRKVSGTRRRREPCVFSVR